MKGSNEEKIVSQKKKKVPYWNVGKHCSRVASPLGLSVCENIFIKRWVPLVRG